MKRQQTIIRKNHMEQLHFITKLLELTDPKLWIPSIEVHIRKLSLNWNTTPHLALIAEVK